MSHHGHDDTGDTVRNRYQAWSEANPKPRGASAIRMPELPEKAARTLGLAVGMGLGALLLLLAVVAATASGSWSGVERGGAAVAYGLTAFFLTVAGLGAITATYNHVFRVLAGPPAHH